MCNGSTYYEDLAKSIEHLALLSVSKLFIDTKAENNQYAVNNQIYFEAKPKLRSYVIQHIKLPSCFAGFLVYNELLLAMI